MILFLLGGGIEGEAIGAGMLQGFAAVHSFVKDEKGEGATGLIRAVSGDFLHIESFLEFTPIFPLAPPDFIGINSSTIFLGKNRKREKEKKETIRQ